MPREVNGKPIRTRAGNHARRMFLRSLQTDKTDLDAGGSTSEVVANGRKHYSPAMFECSEHEETTETHIIPRQSVSAKNHLALILQMDLERLADTKHTQLGKVRNKRGRKVAALIETTDPGRNRIVWKREKTLLRTNKPDAFGEGRGTAFVRTTSNSKRRELQIEEKDAPQGTTILNEPTPDADLDID
jgi:hypothetical protein